VHVSAVPPVSFPTPPPVTPCPPIRHHLNPTHMPSRLY
jgi:hypothetical protein